MIYQINWGADKEYIIDYWKRTHKHIVEDQWIKAFINPLRPPECKEYKIHIDSFEKGYLKKPMKKAKVDIIWNLKGDYFINDTKINIAIIDCSKLHSVKPLEEPALNLRISMSGVSYKRVCERFDSLYM